uniref:Peptidase M20 dimerisation domain-containing protein n=1 Tax=Leersia perrieri TaxID=77586 RepID=A0A0D9XXG8_9ORYZ
MASSLGQCFDMEVVEWEHKSKASMKMHACRHDARTAMLLGAARILQERHQEFFGRFGIVRAHPDIPNGTVVFLFQPGKEVGIGAKRMVEDDGVVDNVEAIFGFHVSVHLPTGMVGSRPGPMLAGASFFEAVIMGKGGHAASPHDSIDLFLAASSVVLALQSLVLLEVVTG